MILEKRNSKLQTVWMPIPWGGRDVLGASGLIVATFLLITVLSVVSKEVREHTLVSSYAIVIIFYLYPMLVISRRYKLKIAEIMVLMTNRFVGLSRIAWIAVVALVLVLIRSTVIGQNSIILLGNADKRILPVWLIVYPLTLPGFQSVILAPFCEEIYFRGFLYQYIRGKLGVKIGLVLQTIIFMILHAWNHELTNFTAVLLDVVAALMFGFIYEYYRNIYYSSAFHGFYNYFIWVFSV